MNGICCIVATDVITPLGSGVETTWQRMLQKNTGIGPAQRYSNGKYSSFVMAEIPEKVEQQRGRTSSGVDGRCFWLAQSVSLNVLGHSNACRNRTGFVLSTTKADIVQLEESITSGHLVGPGHFNPFAMARDLATSMQLGGPVMVISNACASGLVAIIQAKRMLERTDIDAVLVTGIDVLSNFVLSGFSCLSILSKQPCRPYDVARDGLSLGEAAGAMLIRKNDEDNALAVIRGESITNDASHITKPLRNGEGLRNAIEQALCSARLAPSDIGYVNGHGTGTVQNDEMEAQALHAIYGERTPPVGSMKGYIGHTLGAAGIVESALSIVALNENVIPASMGFHSIGVSKQIDVLSDPRQVSNLTHVLALKCGFGGINSAVVLSKPEGRL